MCMMHFCFVLLFKTIVVLQVTFNSYEKQDE